MNPTLLAVLAAALGFVSVAGVGLAIATPADNARLARRMQDLAGEGAGQQRGRRREANDPHQRRRQMLASLRETEQQQRKAVLSLSAKIHQAGLAVDEKLFWIGSAALAVVIAAAAFVLGAPIYLTLTLPIAIGLGAPRWLLGMLAKRRMKRYVEEFANAIDIIVRGIKSGLPVHDCLKIIGKECAQPLGGEFLRIVESLSMGMTLEQSLERAYERMPTAELRFFAIVLSIQAKTGGNLAEALDNLSKVIRARKLMREKIKALSSEATASAMIISALPIVVMILVSFLAPAYMQKMFTDERGQMALAAGAIWMAAGAFIMRRMINFKI